MMKDIRQSPLFARFMSSLGWESFQFHGIYVYLKKFPIMGYFAKISRPHVLLTQKDLDVLKSKFRIFELRIAPNFSDVSETAIKYRRFFKMNGFQIEISPFNPTTTIHIDLTISEEDLFARFSQAKRRAVRRALKNHIRVEVSNDIDEFIRIRKNQYKPLGFLVTKETRTMFEIFSPDHASLLLAYTPSEKRAVSGILMLYYHKMAYYWFAASFPIGKKMFAPTLLVWEALKRAKKNGCTRFDFEGIYDVRFPKAAESWKGFTKFKEGFGGKTVAYMENFKR